MQPEVVVAGVERLTWGEVCARYPDQWVVTIGMERTSETVHPFDTAVVISHHDRRAEASPSVKSTFLNHEVVGTFWTGRKGIWPAARIATR